MKSQVDSFENFIERVTMKPAFNPLLYDIPFLSQKQLMKLHIYLNRWMNTIWYHYLLTEDSWEEKKHYETEPVHVHPLEVSNRMAWFCLLYTSDAADE